MNCTRLGRSPDRGDGPGLVVGRASTAASQYGVLKRRCLAAGHSSGHRQRGNVQSGTCVCKSRSDAIAHCSVRLVYRHRTKSPERRWDARGRITLAVLCANQVRRSEAYRIKPCATLRRAGVYSGVTIRRLKTALSGGGPFFRPPATRKRAVRYVRLQESQRCNSALQCQACLSASNKKPRTPLGRSGPHYARCFCARTRITSEAITL